VADVSASATGSSPAADAAEAAPVSATTMERPAFPTDFLMEALEKSADDSGWAHLGTFGSYLQKIQPDFDLRLHGFKKLSDLDGGGKICLRPRSAARRLGRARCSIFGRRKNGRGWRRSTRTHTFVHEQPLERSAGKRT
jgi:hypothetical protein